MPAAATESVPGPRPAHTPLHLPTSQRQARPPAQRQPRPPAALSSPARAGPCPRTPPPRPRLRATRQPHQPLQAGGALLSAGSSSGTLAHACAPRPAGLRRRQAGPTLPSERRLGLRRESTPGARLPLQQRHAAAVMLAHAALRGHELSRASSSSSPPRGHHVAVTLRRGTCERGDLKVRRADRRRHAARLRGRHRARGAQVRLVSEHREDNVRPHLHA